MVADRHRPGGLPAGTTDRTRTGRLRRDGTTTLGASRSRPLEACARTSSGRKMSHAGGVLSGCVSRADAGSDLR
jgi:hypothetical protein